MGRHVLRKVALFAATIFALSAMAQAGAGRAAVVPNPYPCTQRPNYLPSVSSTDMFGADMSMVGQMGAPDWLPYLDLARDSGLTVVRSGGGWYGAEQNGTLPDLNPNYFWGNYDQWVHDLAWKCLRWEPTLDRYPDWATGETHDQASSNDYPPQIDDAFAQYVGNFAMRYGRNGTFWAEHPELPYLPVTAYEIDNEPNDAYGDSALSDNPHCQPDQYGQLFLAGANAVHAFDENAMVFVGGLSEGGAGCPATDFTLYTVKRSMNNVPRCWKFPPPPRFGCGALPWILAAGRNVGIGLHPYASDWQTTEDDVWGFRQLLDAVEAWTVPLYLTEFGWVNATGCTNATYCDRSMYDTTGMYTRAYAFTRVAYDLALSHCGVVNMTPFSWVTPELHPWSPTDWFGLVHPQLDATGKAVAWPAGDAYTRAVRNMRGLGWKSPQTAPTREVCPGITVKGQQYDIPDLPNIPVSPRLP